MIKFGIFGAPEALEKAMAKSMLDKLDKQMTSAEENEKLWKVIDDYLGALFELEEEASNKDTETSNSINSYIANSFGEAQSLLCAKLIDAGLYTELTKFSSSKD